MNTGFLQSDKLIPTIQNQVGIGLIELMISLALGLLVLLIGTALIISTKSSFLTQSDHLDIQESASFALDNVARSLRQAGYVNYDFNNSPQITPSSASADIVGMDGSAVSPTADDISSPSNSSINSSDLLGIRFFGRGGIGSGDGTITNCAGFSVPAPSSSDTADEDRGWSIYYVAYNANREPELFCKYQSINSKSGAMGWSAQAIVKGVESFQVLYGVDTSNPTNGSANKFLNASAINALDANLELVGITSAELKADLNRKTFWKKVTEVKIAMLISGGEVSRHESATKTYNLFGDEYAAIASSFDRGTTVSEVEISAARRNRLRKIFASTIVLRNNCPIDPIRGTCQAPS
ncbi:PilW family protein [Undibacterium sp. SXout20W]|uniref:PilW family protein n=1 Tax=Undibacterium sp. SXout20W TaxID=3413051 RepID=UPI003BEFA47E